MISSCGSRDHPTYWNMSFIWMCSVNEWMNESSSIIIQRGKYPIIGNTLSSSGPLKLGPLPVTQMWNVMKRLLKLAGSSPFCFLFAERAEGRAWWTPPLMRRPDIKPQKGKSWHSFALSRYSVHVFDSLMTMWTLSMYLSLREGPDGLPPGTHHELVKVTVVLLCL